MSSDRDDLPLLTYRQPYGGKPPAQSHSPTSREAARAMLAKGEFENKRDAVHAFLVERGDTGATDDEMQRALRMNPSTQRPRRCELVELALVVDTGRTRKTRAGGMATVWRAVTSDEPVTVQTTTETNVMRGKCRALLRTASLDQLREAYLALKPTTTE